MLIALPAIKAHLRLEADYPDAQVSIYADAAAEAAAQFMNRRVFATDADLLAARALVPAALQAASVAHAAAVEAASQISDPVLRCAELDSADSVYRAAQAAAAETRAGLVINAAVNAAILLICGHLFENRQDVITGTIATQIPNGSLYLLQPYRVGLGV